MSFQTIEQKKDAFQKFLSQVGLVDQITRVLISLYEEPEKPVNPIEYIKNCLGPPSDIDGDKLKIEFDKLNDENRKLKIQIDNIKKEILIYKPKE